MRPVPEVPGPGQESVWDYPRPPAVVPSESHVVVVHAGVTLADSTRSVCVLETSQPPAYYVPIADVDMDRLVRSDSRTLCEWKGLATYWTVRAGTIVVPDAAWGYEEPTAGYEPLRDHVAFYAQKLDECWVDEERVASNDGSFYGGWITSRVTGPFKGGQGSLGW